MSKTCQPSVWYYIMALFSKENEVTYHRIFIGAFSLGFPTELSCVIYSAMKIKTIGTTILKFDNSYIGYEVVNIIIPQAFLLLSYVILIDMSSS